MDWQEPKTKALMMTVKQRTYGALGKRVLR